MFQTELEEAAKKDVEFLTRQFDTLTTFSQESDAFFSSVSEFFGKFKRTGKFPSINTLFKDDHKNSETDSLKENEEVVVKKEPVSPQKPQRKGLKKTLQVHNENVESPAQQKSSITIKQEKLSILNKVVTTSSNENMPPPPVPLERPIKKETNTRTTRARTRKNNQINPAMPEENRKDSDVILNNVNVTVLEVSSEDETDMSEKMSTASSIPSERDKTFAKPETIRSTRSRAKKTNKKAESSNEKPKRSRSLSVEEGNNKTKSARSKRTKRKKAEDNETKTDSSAYEDATDEEKQPAVAKDNKERLTAVKSSAAAIAGRIMNETYVQPTTDANKILSDIMTDDDSPIQVAAKPVRDVVAKGKTKQLFSPFEKSPVKKRVQAYENLAAEAASEIPIRTTRTKTRELAKLKDTEDEANSAISQETNAKGKTKFGTPVGTSKYLPMFHSTSKIMKQSSNESLSIPKSLSSIKSSQADFRERELRRQKEAQKREALLQAQLEEKRRKREEKQLKAQLQREALEKEKQKNLELAEKLREEKLKQALAERDVKMIKQKEEMERKRQLAKKKALEEKLKEEDKKKTEMRDKEQMELPYMISKAPLLPTVDCYDSDQEQESEAQLPAWCDDKVLKITQRCMYVAEELKNTFFCRSTTTVNLKEIFKQIDPRKLKRTSSAVWRTPPRFTLLPKLDATVERNDYSTDEE